jgi:hypothetical protein
MKKNISLNKIMGLTLLLCCEAAATSPHLNDAQFDILSQFSSSKKQQLAQIGLENGCTTMDELVDKVATLNWNGGNENLQQDVDNLLDVMGNVNGVTLQQKGTSIKNDISPLSPTIDLSIQQVETDLGGNGDLHIRSQVIQLLIPGPNLLEGAQTANATIQALNTTINDNKNTLDQTVGHTLPQAVEDVYGIVITTPAQRGIDLLTDITATRDLLPGPGDLHTRVEAVDAIIQALNTTINDNKNTLDQTVGHTLPQAVEDVYSIVITNPADRGVDLITDITAILNLFPGVGDLRTRAEALITEIATLKTDIIDIGDALIPLAGRARAFGPYPPLPAQPLTTKAPIVGYIETINDNN